MQESKHKPTAKNPVFGMAEAKAQIPLIAVPKPQNPFTGMVLEFFDTMKDSINEEYNFMKILMDKVSANPYIHRELNSVPPEYFFELSSFNDKLVQTFEEVLKAQKATF